MTDREYAPRHYKEKVLLFFAGAIFLIGYSCVLGRYPLRMGEILSFLLSLLSGGTPEVPLPEITRTLLYNIRFPRIVAALLAGAALATSGVAFQGVFQNPLASPSLLGASAGAGFGAALGLYFSFSIVGIETSAFLGGLGAVGLTCLIGGRFKKSGSLGLILSGIMITSLFSAAISLFKFFADPSDTLPSIVFWLMGSLSGVDMADVRWMSLPIVAGVGTLILFRWHLNVLSLGEEEAQVLGLSVKPWRFLVILCATLATASSVAVAGMIGWIGLVVPHFTRLLFGADFRRTLPMTALLGGMFLLGVDDLARVVAAVEIPLGVLTALVGIPCFLLLMYAQERGAP